MKPPSIVRRSACGIVLLALLPAVAAPRLEVHRPSGTTLELRWSAAEAGFALEAADTLATPTDWQAVVGAPALVNSIKSVTLPVGQRNVTLDWIGGVGSYLIEAATDLGLGDWIEAAAATPNQSETPAVPPGHSFFRIRSPGLLP